MLLKNLMKRFYCALSDKIIWLNEKELRIKDIVFTLDTTIGPVRRISEHNNFTLVKTRNHVKDYNRFASYKFEHILDLGIFQGGSLVFFDKLFNPSKLAGIDIKRERVEALDHYIDENNRNIALYYKHSQDDIELLNIIFEDFLMVG